MAGPQSVFEKRYLRADGSVMWARLTLSADEASRSMISIIEDITARREADLLARLRDAALHAAANGIAITDRSGRIQWVNPAFERLTGYSAADAVGTALASAETDDSQRASWQTVLGGDVWAGDLVTRRKDGTYYDEHQTIAPVRDATGEVTHFIAIKEDVSERTRAAAALAASESRLRTVLEHLPIPVGLATTSGEVVLYNAAFVARFGYTRADIPRVEDWMAQAYPDLALRAQISTQWRADLERGTPFEGVAIVPTVTKTGDVRDVRILGSRLGELVLAVFDDVTDERRRTAAVAQAEERQRLALEAAGLGIWRIDHRTDVATLDERARTLLGFTSDRVPRVELEARLGDARGLPGNGNAQIRRTLHRVVLPQAAPRWIETHTKVNPEDGDATVLARDVTDAQTAEEQLRVAQKMEAVGRLAGGVAHDFNNLLTVILSCTDMALAEAVSAEIRDLLLDVENAGRRASGLTRQLLAFSRRQVLQPEPVGISELAIQLGKMLERLIGEDIALKIVPANTHTIAMVDRGQIEQVVMNLAVNARDAMPDGGALTITTDQCELDADDAAALELPPGHYVRLAVADTGTGMDAAIRARIFEPFFTTKEQGRGTGLGLSTVFGIVKQSNGSIGVSSTPGAGSTFTVYLPLAEDTPVALAPRRSVARPPGGHETILVVEDEPAVRAVVGRALERAGYRVLVAATPGEALALAQQHRAAIQLILTDVVMPEMNGRVLAEKLAECCPAAEILYTSGYTDDALLRSGVLHHLLLPKPFDAQVLVARVREILDGRHRSATSGVEPTARATTHG